MIDPDQSLSFPEVVDSSMLLDADACDEKFHKHYLQHWGPLRHSVDLHAGGAFAHGIEHVRNALWRPNSKNKELSDAINVGVRELLTYWDGFEPPDNHAKTMINTAGALIDYFREYDPAFDHVKPYYMTNGEPAIEFTFAIPTAVAHPVTGNPILYGGRFDMLGWDYARLTIVDEKTTGRAPDSKVGDVHRMRGQFIGYVFAGRYHEFDVWDMLVRIVVIQKTQYKYFAVPLTYQQWQLDRWWEEVHRKLYHAVEQWKEGNWGRSYGEACSSYSGCSFLPLCTMRDPDMWLNDYAQRFWNPLEQDPTRRNATPEELEA